MARVKRYALTFISLILLLTSCSTINNTLQKQNNVNHSIHNGNYLGCSICNSNKTENRLEIKRIESSNDELMASNEKLENPNSTFYTVLNSFKNDDVEKVEHVKILNAKSKYQKKVIRKFTKELDNKIDQVDEVKPKDAGLGLAIAGLFFGILGLTIMPIAIILIPIGILLSIIAWKKSTKGELARALAILGAIFNVIAFIIIIIFSLFLTTLFAIMLI